MGYNFDRVSDWFDADSFKVFTTTVRSGDILELRSTRCSHWGIAIRIKQAPISPKSKSKSKPPKAVPDEIMVYHLIHSSKNRGQVGQFTLEEFWHADCRIRINNTNNGASLYTTSPIMSKTDILQNAFIAHASTQLKWQTCAEFIRWASVEQQEDIIRRSPVTSRNTPTIACTSTS